MFLPRTVLSVVVAAACGYAVAQQSNNDYYAARSSARLSELLVAVEKYHLQPGIDKFRARQYPAAWGDFQFILNYFPNHPRALVLMGGLCETWRTPKCNMATYFDQALRVAPESSGVYLTQGVYLQKQGKLNEAIESYKKSLQFDPSSANAHYNLGLAYAAAKRFDLANEHAQQAYASGVSLPGLQSKLVAAGAWKPLAAKPAEAPVTIDPQHPPAGAANREETNPKLPEPDRKSSDGGK